MKPIREMLGQSTKPKKALSKRIKVMLNQWAIEAHQLDSSKSIRHYYELFLNELRKRYVAVNAGDNQTSWKASKSHFKNEIIDV